MAKILPMAQFGVDKLQILKPLLHILNEMKVKNLLEYEFDKMYRVKDGKL